MIYRMAFGETDHPLTPPTEGLRNGMAFGADIPPDPLITCGSAYGDLHPARTGDSYVYPDDSTDPYRIFLSDTFVNS